MKYIGIVIIAIVIWSMLELYLGTNIPRMTRVMRITAISVWLLWSIIVWISVPNLDWVGNLIFTLMSGVAFLYIGYRRQKFCPECSHIVIFDGFFRRYFFGKCIFCLTDLPEPAPRKYGYKPMVAAIALTLLLLLLLILWTEIPRDRCLDRGGRWDAASRACSWEPVVIPAES